LAIDRQAALAAMSSHDEAATAARVAQIQAKREGLRSVPTVADIESIRVGAMPVATFTAKLKTACSPIILRW